MSEEMKTKTFSILVCFVTAIHINAQKLDLFFGFSQNTPSLIKHIRKLILPSEASQPYNFTKTFENVGRSQFGQDETVLKLLNYKKNGIFIEAGAYDGEVHSNTLQLELNYNWTGILIEPNPENFKTMLTKKRKCHFLNACLSTSNTVKEEYFDAAGKYLYVIGECVKP